MKVLLRNVRNMEGVLGRPRRVGRVTRQSVAVAADTSTSLLRWPGAPVARLLHRLTRDPVAGTPESGDQPRDRARLRGPRARHRTRRGAGPAHHDYARVHWPAPGAALEAPTPGATTWYSPVLLSAHSAAALTVDIPCVLPSSTDGVTVLSTMRHPERAQRAHHRPSRRFSRGRGRP